MRLRRPSARWRWRELLPRGRPAFLSRCVALRPAARCVPPRDALSQRALPARAPEPPRAATLNLRARMRPRPAPILLILYLAGSDVLRTRGSSNARAPYVLTFQSSNTGCFLTSPSWRLELVHDLQNQPRWVSLHRTRSARIATLAHAHPPRRFRSGRSESSSPAWSAEQLNDPFGVKFASYLILSRFNGYPLHHRCRGRAGGPKRRRRGRGEPAEGSRGGALRSPPSMRWMQPLGGPARAMSMSMVPPAAPQFHTPRGAARTLEWPEKGPGGDVEPRSAVLACTRTMRP